MERRIGDFATFTRDFADYHDRRACDVMRSDIVGKAIDPRAELALARQ